MSLLIAAERGAFDMIGFLGSLGEAPVALAAITASELLHGVERARDAATRTRRGSYVEGVLSNIPAVPFGLEEARMHARVWAGLAAKGKLVGAHDLLVAATALSIGSAVATMDQKDFRRVPGITLARVDEFMRKPLS